MNRWFLLSGLLTAGTVWLHVVGGGPEFHLPIQGSDLPIELRAMSAVLWHAITIILSVFAMIYIWAARFGHRILIAWIGLIQFGFAGLFLYYGVALLGSVWPLPQWVIFFAIPAISAAGFRRSLTNSLS